MSKTRRFLFFFFNKSKAISCYCYNSCDLGWLSPLRACVYSHSLVAQKIIVRNIMVGERLDWNTERTDTLCFL
jgi:hypothetical protein